MRELADRALEADRDDAFALVAGSFARLMAEESDDGVALARRAMELNPNLAVAYTGLLLGQMQKADYEQALQSADAALELSPRDPLRSMMLAMRGILLLMLWRYDDMLTNAREILHEYPASPAGHRQCAVAHVRLGNLRAAKAVVDDHIVRLLPGHTATASGQQIPFADHDTARSFWVECLVKAGLPR